MVFISSLILSLVLIYLQNKKGFGRDSEMGVQKFHQGNIARTGGLAIFISFFFFDFISGQLFFKSMYLPVLFLVIFSSLEDFGYFLKPLIRLLFLILFSTMIVTSSNLGIYDLNFWFFDDLLENSFVNIAFTSITIALVMNAVNVIDGFNGLVAGFISIILISIMFIANSIGDKVIYDTSLLMLAAILGFFCLNFPFVKIFLGDAGAYLIGSLISFLLIKFVSNNSEISPWLALSLLIYPVFEIVFSIVRKKYFFNSRAFYPDEYHLHMLVHKNLLNCKLFQDKKHFCNSFTSIFIWLLSLTTVIPSVIWYSEPSYLFLVSIAFMLIYLFFYIMLFRLEKRTK